MGAGFGAKTNVHDGLKPRFAVISVFRVECALNDASHLRKANGKAIFPAFVEVVELGDGTVTNLQPNTPSNNLNPLA